MRLAMFFVVVGLVGFAMADVAEERPLQPIKRHVMTDETNCLPFFIGTKTTFEGKVTERVIFWYTASDGSLKRDSTPKAEAVVYVFEESRTPTYEKVSAEGYQDGAVFRLSRAYYDEKAHACLPEPTKATQ